MSQALYRKYRSKRLSEIVGQEQVTALLERALAAKNTGHAYLLTGPRGTGKTSIARILAHEITQLEYSEKEQHLDIIEIDAASNNGVEDVRDLRDKALIAPSRAAKKVYIIDEVHMLSKAAFNALLKILEEPPAHVVFILATTDFEKVPITIVSRTQRYHFRLVEHNKVVQHLAYIAKQENINIEPAALELIAERGGGSFRDSISLLDQLRHSDTSTISAKTVELALGLATQSEVHALVAAVQSSDAAAIVRTLQEIEGRGVGAPMLATQVSSAIRRLVARQPSLVHYLEGLESVPRASHPEITLLVTLLEHAVTKPQAPTPTNASTVKAHAAPAVVPQATKVVSTKPATPQPTTTPPKASAPYPKSTSANTPESIVSEPTPQPVKSTGEFHPEQFDWEKILAYAAEHKEKFIGVHSLLAKCSPQLGDHKVLLYTGNKFNKNKLDSAKNRMVLGKIFAETGVGDIDIETIASSMPPKDEQTARIAAMMGGGEEIDV